MAPLDGMAGALSRGSRTPGAVRGDACTRRRLNTTESQHQRAARAATALLHRLCTWPSLGVIS